MLRNQKYIPADYGDFRRVGLKIFSVNLRHLRETFDHVETILLIPEMKIK